MTTVEVQRDPLGPDLVLDSGKGCGKEKTFPRIPKPFPKRTLKFILVRSGGHNEIIKLVRNQTLILFVNWDAETTRHVNQVINSKASANTFDDSDLDLLPNEDYVQTVSERT